MISNMTSCCSCWKSMLYVVMLYVCNVVSMYKTILCEDKRSHAKLPYRALTRLSIVSHDLRAAALPPRRVTWSSQPCKGWSCSDCSPGLNICLIMTLQHHYDVRHDEFIINYWLHAILLLCLFWQYKLPEKHLNACQEWPHNNKLKWFYCLSIRGLQYRYMLHTCNS